MEPVKPITANVVSAANQLALESPLFISVFRAQKAEQAAAIAAGVASRTAPKITLTTPADQATLLKSERFQFSSIEISRLINKISPEGITFQQLRNFPDVGLTQEQRLIRSFLLKSPNTFKQLAALDKNAKTLSATDIQIAASLAGEVKTLTNEDLKKIDVVFSSRDNFEKAAPTDQTNRVAQSRLTQDYLARDAVNNLTRPLETRNQATPPLDTRFAAGQVKPPANNPLANNPLFDEEVDDLSRNELVKAARSTQFAPQMRAASGEDVENETTTEDRMRVNPIRSDEIRQVLRTRQKIQLHAHDVQSLFKSINNGKAITLAHLRMYRPKNKKEEQVLSVIRRLKVFEELSHMDGNEETLDLADIQIATDGKSFILSDPYMYLVIDPD